MNPEQQQSYIRSALLTAVGAILGGVVIKGWLTPDQATMITEGIVAIMMGVGAAALAKWGSMSHSGPAITAAVNSNSAPGVKVVLERSSDPPVNLDSAGKIVPAPKTDAPLK